MFTDFFKNPFFYFSVNVIVEEKCSIELERDCSLKKFTVQGALPLWITDPTYDRIKIKAGASADKIIYRVNHVN